ncbi:MAG: alpha/beta hydrolase [Acidimicrobiales bacterium]
MREGDDGRLPIPAGHRVLLPGRGTTFVRELNEVGDGPSVLLVHGWVASGGLNWLTAFEPLGRDFHVLAADNRGHGRGIQSRRRFTIADAADDLAALLDVLGIENVVVVGYSLGGPIAQMLWRRHPERVAGLVFCATGFDLIEGGGTRMAMAGAATMLAAGLRAGALPSSFPSALARQVTREARGANRPQTLSKWARAEMQRHSWRMVSEAGLAIGTYSSRAWVGEIDVPTSVIVTQRDRAVPPQAQYGLASHIPGARIHRYDGGHVSCLEPEFGETVRDAVTGVVDRAGTAPALDVTVDGLPPTDVIDLRTKRRAAVRTAS